MALKVALFLGEQAWTWADAPTTSWHPHNPTTSTRTPTPLCLSYSPSQCRGALLLSKTSSPRPSSFASNMTATETPPWTTVSWASAEGDNPTAEDHDDKPFSIKGDLLVEYESDLVRQEMMKLWKVWWKRGWAPWEESLSPETEFALDKFKDPSNRRSSWESFKKVHPASRPEIIEIRKRLIRKKLQGQIDEFVEMRNKAMDMKESLWEKPLVFGLLPPRDWPPPGWKVDAKELAYIREAYKLEAVRISSEDVENAIDDEDAEVSLDRWHMFMKQYNEWVAVNKAILDKESMESDLQYVPGRRRTGKNYEEGMYELPFVYPGQHYWGVVTCVHLYQGAFVYFGAVHDGLVQARLNDWYHLQKYIKVGMRVHVEVIAKRDPYRFRFPIELRFVEPNVDKFIFNRFEYPPIFQRPGDNNLDEVAREIKRPYIPEMRPKPKPSVDPDILIHPCIPQVWKVHNAEQMMLDAEENPGSVSTSDYDFFKKKHEDDDESERPDCVWTKKVINDSTIPILMVRVDESELNLDAARAERQVVRKMLQEAKAEGKKVIKPSLQKEIWMDSLNQMHRRRTKAELNALRRDITSRNEFGLPIEEPGKYVNFPYKKNVYNPRDIMWRKDYLGDLTKSKRKSKYNRKYASKSSRESPRKTAVKIEEKVEQGPQKEVITGSTYILQDGDSIKSEHWYLSEDSENETADLQSGSTDWIDVFTTSKGDAPIIFEEAEGMYEDEDEDEDEDWDDDEDVYAVAGANDDEGVDKDDNEDCDEDEDRGGDEDNTDDNVEDNNDDNKEEDA